MVIKDSDRSQGTSQVEFNQREFRDALGLFPTGVAVITAAASIYEQPIGITVSSFSSVSLDPPLILFSIDNRCLSLEELKCSKGYAVNVLGQYQQALSNRFAASREDKWADIDFHCGVTNSPLLASASAIFECEPYEQYGGGDHIIFVGKVINIARVHDDEPLPLVFYRGAYRELNSSNSARKQ